MVAIVPFLGCTHECTAGFFPSMIIHYATLATPSFLSWYMQRRTFLYFDDTNNACTKRRDEEGVFS